MFSILVAATYKNLKHVGEKTFDAASIKKNMQKENPTRVSCGVRTLYAPRFSFGP